MRRHEMEELLYDIEKEVARNTRRMLDSVKKVLAYYDDDEQEAKCRAEHPELFRPEDGRTDAPDTLGGRLRRARLRQGMSMQQLCYAADLRMWKYINYELDAVRPDDDELAALASALGAELSWLKDGELSVIA